MLILLYPLFNKLKKDHYQKIYDFLIIYGQKLKSLILFFTRSTFVRSFNKDSSYSVLICSISKNQRFFDIVGVKLKIFDF